MANLFPPRLETCKGVLQAIPGLATKAGSLEEKDVDKPAGFYPGRRVIASRVWWLCRGVRVVAIASLTLFGLLRIFAKEIRGE